MTAILAVKAISRLQWNGGFGRDFGRSRGDPCTCASRPTEASKAAVCYVRNTSSPDIQSLATSTLGGPSPLPNAQAAISRPRA